MTATWLAHVNVGRARGCVVWPWPVPCFCLVLRELPAHVNFDTVVRVEYSYIRGYAIRRPGDLEGTSSPGPQRPGALDRCAGVTMAVGWLGTAHNTRHHPWSHAHVTRAVNGLRLHDALGTCHMAQGRADTRALATANRKKDTSSTNMRQNPPRTRLLSRMLSPSAHPSRSLPPNIHNHPHLFHALSLPSATSPHTGGVPTTRLKRPTVPWPQRWSVSPPTHLRHTHTTSSMVAHVENSPPASWRAALVPLLWRIVVRGCGFVFRRGWRLTTGE